MPYNTSMASAEWSCAVRSCIIAGTSHRCSCLSSWTCHFPSFPCFPASLAAVPLRAYTPPGAQLHQQGCARLLLAAGNTFVWHFCASFAEHRTFVVPSGCLRSAFAQPLHKAKHVTFAPVTCRKGTITFALLVYIYIYVYIYVYIYKVITRPTN